MKNDLIFSSISTKNNKFIIRYPNKNDVGKINEYINHLSSEKTFISFQGEKYSLKEENEYLTDQLKRIKKNQSVQLLVIINNKVIGISNIDLKDGASSHVGVLGISLLREYRNEGIGKILFNLILKEAEENISNLKIITISVFGNNEIAYKIYKNFGFKEYGRLPKGIKHKNIFVDHVLLYKNVEFSS